MEEGRRRKSPPWMPASPSPRRQASVGSSASPPASEGDLEEEQIEEFYMLVKGIKAARDLWKTPPKSKRQRREGSFLWKPAFEWEDFAKAGRSKLREDGDAKISSPRERGEAGIS